MRSRKQMLILAATVSASMFVLAACGGQRPNTQPAPSGDAATGCTATAGRVAMATGNTTGVYYVLGGGIASVVSKGTPLQMTAAETGASVQNIEQLVAGEYQVAFSLADTAADAVAGTGAFSSPQPIQALARIHTNFTQVVVRANSGINSIADMKGKVVSTGSPKSGTELVANRLLQSAGLNPETDIKAQRLDLAKTVDGLKGGSIDAMFWSGGLPTAGLTDLFTTNAKDVKFIDITPQLTELKKINPVYTTGSIPQATYPGMTADAPTIVVPNFLLVRNDFPRNNACAITKAIFENIDQLATVHAVAKTFDKTVARQTDPVPLAPGSKDALDQLG